MKLRVATLAAALALASHNIAVAQNCSCEPARNGSTVSGVRTVWVAGMSTTDRNNIIAAFEEWNYAVMERSFPVEFEHTDSTSADIIVRIGSTSMPTSVGMQTNKDGTGRGVITVNPYYLNKGLGVIWQWATHEVGHMVNFADKTSCSARDTVMYYLQPTNTAITGITCADQGAINKQWASQESPILIDFRGHGMVLSSAEDGVLFDIRASGILERVAWPARSNVGFLVLDRNGNGRVDSSAEMFGNHTPLADGNTAAHGFQALAEFDDNSDDWIDQNDEVYSRLRLWIDANRDGVSGTEEYSTLQAVGVAALSLRYQLTERVDQWGNAFRYRARAEAKGEAAAYLWDVFLVWQPTF